MVELAGPAGVLGPHERRAAPAGARPRARAAARGRRAGRDGPPAPAGALHRRVPSCGRRLTLGRPPATQPAAHHAWATSSATVVSVSSATSGSSWPSYATVAAAPGTVAPTDTTVERRSPVQRSRSASYGEPGSRSSR